MSEPAQDEAPPGCIRRLARRLNPVRIWGVHRVSISLGFLVLAFFVVLLWNRILVPIKPGEQGVYWSRFGGGTRDRIIGEGTAWKLPWDRIHVYDVRMQHASGTTQLLTVDGMQLEIEWSARYYPRREKLPTLHRTIGPNYESKVVVPEVISAMRRVIGNFRADLIYARDEAGLIANLTELVKKELHDHPILFDDMLIRRLTLPKEMADEIVQKLIHEQRLHAYEFRLKAEEKEKLRREIEAAGIKKFEEISGIRILKWRGIDATIEIAKSPNTKIIVIGTDSKGLPIILNTEK